jgi:hypothetical protein
MSFCTVTPVSIQVFVEGMPRLANVLEATHGTLKNVFIRWLLFQTFIYIYIYCKCCKCCNHMQHSSSHTSKVTGKQYKIFCTINCKSANVIYNVWKSSQRMNLRDVGSEASANDSVQTNKVINTCLKCSTTQKKC